VQTRGGVRLVRSHPLHAQERLLRRRGRPIVRLVDDRTIAQLARASVRRTASEPDDDRGALLVSSHQTSPAENKLCSGSAGTGAPFRSGIAFAYSAMSANDMLVALAVIGLTIRRADPEEPLEIFLRGAIVGRVNPIWQKGDDLRPALEMYRPYAYRCADSFAPARPPSPTRSRRRRSLPSRRFMDAIPTRIFNPRHLRLIWPDQAGRH